MKSFLFKVALITLVFPMLMAPALVTAKTKTTITKSKTVSRLASVQYLDTKPCLRDNVNVIVSKLPEKKLEISVFRFNMCTQQSVINETVITQDPSTFKLNGTESARADFKGQFPNGTPVEVHLKWKAQGDSDTQEFSNTEEENGCQVIFTGSHTSSPPYTVTGSVVVDGENYIAGVTPNDATIARDVSRTKTICPK